MRYSPFRHVGSIFRRRNPIQLTFFVTRRCNANCPFCFYLAGNGGKAGGAELTLDEIEKVSASLGKLMWLSLSGGELFLRSDISEIVKIFYKQNRPAIILLSTNGLMPDDIREKTEEILRYCKKSTVVVKLSIDGPEELNDSLRGVAGAYKKTVATYRALEKLIPAYPNLELGINTVFCSKNQKIMNEIVENVKGLNGKRTHTVSLIRGDVFDESLKDVDPDLYRKTIESLDTNLKQGRLGMYSFSGAKLKAAQDILQRRFIYKTMLERKRTSDCYAGRLALVITENGDIYPCETFSMKIGNVRESGYDLKKLMKTKRAKEIAESIENRECWCTHECYHMMNIFFNPRMYPALLKEYLRV
jgi:radical SAM protein with 4Fe4S-binding SPASM domain